VYGLGYGYDPRQVAARQVPRSAAGFTGPRCRGRVISTYPHQDDVTLYLYSVLAERHGWSFTGQLLASSPQFVNGHLGVAQGLAAGTAALSSGHIISLAPPIAGRAAWRSRSRPTIRCRYGRRTPRSLTDHPARQRPGCSCAGYWNPISRTPSPGRRLVTAPRHRAAAGPGAAG
jgi:hypothetical protein